MRGNSRFGVGLSRAADPVAAADEACAAARAMLGDPGAPTLVVMFASPDLCAEAELLLARVHEALAPEHLIGSMGEAIIAEGLEIEDGPALVVWAAQLPGVEVIPFRLVARPLGEGLGVLGWPDAITDAPAGSVGPGVDAGRSLLLPGGRPAHRAAATSRPRRWWWAGWPRGACARASTACSRARTSWSRAPWPWACGARTP